MAHWRNAPDIPTIMGVDLRSLFPIIAWMFYPSWFTFIFAIVGIIFFVGLSLFGYPLPIFIRWIRHKLRGNVLDSEGWLYWRRYKK